MSNNRLLSTFRHLRRKQINIHSNHFLIEQENHIQSTGDNSYFEHIHIQPSTIINYNDYLYMIYLFILSIFYFYYIRIILQEKTNQFDDNDLYSYFDNYEREIPRLLWFRKGYRLH